jgi:hypothetical protein
MLDLIKCVKRNGVEIEWFHDEKAAKTWIQHTLGVTLTEARNIGITIEGFGKRGPKVGDPVIYYGEGTNYDYLVKESKVSHRPAVEFVEGILDGTFGGLGICFAASAYRQGDHVSCSGGPVPFINANSLTYVGLKRTQFWRWSNGYAGAGQGGNYHITLPQWRWNGV